MNREEILNLSAGREMDALIAEKIFGYVRMRYPDYESWGECYDDIEYPNATCFRQVPFYRWSTNIAEAWKVVEEMHECGYWVQVRSPFGTGNSNDGYWAGFTPHLCTGWNHTPDNWTNAQTAPLAICRAALLTVTGIENE